MRSREIRVHVAGTVPITMAEQVHALALVMDVTVTAIVEQGLRHVLDQAKAAGVKLPEVPKHGHRGAGGYAKRRRLNQMDRLA